MPTVLYLLLGLAAIGALAFAFYQVTARQRRLMAELTRLERLTAEVVMSAEAVLDEVDQRVAELKRLADALASAPGEGRAGSTLSGRASAETEEPTPTQTAAQMPPQELPEMPAQTPIQAATRAPAQKPAQEPAGSVPQHGDADRSADRYTAAREAVYRLADEGKSPVEIAEALGFPRGEVQLILNLRGRIPQA